MIEVRLIRPADEVQEALQREAAEIKLRCRSVELRRGCQHRETMSIADCLVFTNKSRRTCPYGDNLSQDLPFERESVVEVKMART